MITVLGSSGFIGTNLHKYLVQHQFEIFVPSRNADLRKRDLGDTIYCIGLTSDFRQRPFATIDAHINKLAEILRHCQFSSLTYLSSTRVYQRLQKQNANEEDVLPVVSADPGDLYNLSKLMGESIALTTSEKTRIVRLSNVYGNDFSSSNFLSAIIREALANRHISLKSSLESSKDYIHVDDVVDALVKIATDGKQRVYNVASGQNHTTADIVNAISAQTNCTYTVNDNAITVKFPAINIQRLQNEFDFNPKNLLDNINALIDYYRA